MKKAGQLAALLFAAVAFWALNPHIVRARQIGTNPTGASADQWCVGGRIRGNTSLATTEVCVDSSGNVIPTTTGVATLGTASLAWLQGWITTLTATTVTTANLTATYTAATSTGTVINSAASPTADILEVQINGSTVAVVSPLGGFKPYALPLATIQATTPNTIDLGGLYICKDCAAVYSICVATGTTKQGFRLSGSGTAECK